LGGFQWRGLVDGFAVVEAPDAGLVEKLLPGERRAVGWLRLDKPGEVRVEISSVGP
jgi:hypothetical protein